MSQNDNEFYIGWMPEAPGSYRATLRKGLHFLIVLVVLIAAVITLKQKPFSTANFEFGKPTVVEGVYRSVPTPHLLVSYQKDMFMVPLVGYGKHGANGTMKALEDEIKTSLEGKEIKLRGTLLYGDGKVFMQIEPDGHPLIGAVQPSSLVTAPPSDGTDTSLEGEVIDPKCFFGVMKPGEGKAHKDCAIRCLSGGIPPVLKISNKKGGNNYVLITRKQGDVFEKVKDFVAVPSILKGHLTAYHNWQVLELSTIKRDLAQKSIRKEPVAGICGDAKSAERACWAF